MWLDAVEAECPTEDVLLHIYNPTNFVKPLIHYTPDRYLECAPSLSAGVAAPGVEDFHWCLQGDLLWDGRTSPPILDCVKSVYNESAWLLATIPLDPAMDLELLSRLGLSYGLFEVRDEGTPVRLEVTPDGLVRVAPDAAIAAVTNGDEIEVAIKWNGAAPFGSFLTTRAAEVDELWNDIGGPDIFRPF